MGEQKLVQLRLPKEDVLQILAGLDVLAEQWEQTASYMENGDGEGEDIVIRECSGAAEARSIANCYRQIECVVSNQL